MQLQNALSLKSLIRKPWIWSFLGVFAMWLATVAFTKGQGGGDVITAALSFATFTVIVGLGQMFGFRFPENFH